MFAECVFRFQVTIVPPREGILAMRQLTTANYETSVNISLG
jgi:hypothetical protein